jgi:hypothetical protein
MVRRPIPAIEVLRGTTPVISFGNSLQARVATLGINPSSREFVAKSGDLMAGPNRRLATLDSLGVAGVESLKVRQIQTVIEECASYFQRRPYRRWFDPLNQVLQDGLSASYYEGTACHLDLVQWATDPFWGELPRKAKKLLLEDQLRFSKIRLVILNGRQVIDQVHNVGLAKLDVRGRLPFARGVYSLYSGSGAGVEFLGWSANLQNSRGDVKELKELKSRITRWLAASVTTRKLLE